MWMTVGLSKVMRRVRRAQPSWKAMVLEKEGSGEACSWEVMRERVRGASERGVCVGMVRSSVAILGCVAICRGNVM